MNFPRQRLAREIHLISLECMERVIILFALIISTLSNSAQEWPKIYGDESSAKGRYVIETYDKGYLLLGDRNGYKYAGLTKTDINGNVLWVKRIGDNNAQTISVNITQTSDKGYIICGGTDINDPWNDAFIQKLDVCAEPEWCRIFHTEGDEDDYGQRIKQLSDGSYLFLTRYLGTNPDHRIHLTKLDEYGNMIWQQVYAPENWPVFNEEGFDLTIVNENRYLVTGECFYPDPGDTLYGWRRPYFIMTDSVGDLVWETPWLMDGYYVGGTRASVVDSNGVIYTSAKKHNRNEVENIPALLKTSSSGNEIDSYPLLEGYAYGIGTTISWINDSVLFMSAGWLDELDILHNAFFKVDTLGNIIDSMNFQPMSAGTYWTTKTFDGKFVSVATHYDGNWDMYAFKVNENMEYDSIYTGYYEYDYLCPDSIETETYDLECDIIVDIDEPFTTKEGSKIKVFPNPATEQVTIQLPEYIITEKHSGNWEVTKVNYQYNGPALLEFYDSFGKKIHSMEINSSQKEISLNIPGWQPGLYVVVLMKEGRKIDQQKLLLVD